jgi:hypothetical protein
LLEKHYRDALGVRRWTTDPRPRLPGNTVARWERDERGIAELQWPDLDPEQRQIRVARAFSHGSRCLPQERPWKMNGQVARRWVRWRSTAAMSSGLFWESAGI